MAISASLIEFLRGTYRLNWEGFHGAPHWTRVRDNGLRLARTTGASVQIVEYFAFLHDSCRENDGQDPGHGWRAARLAEAIRDLHVPLDGSEFDLLVRALEGHTGGTDPRDITVATCWDADRLDLGRVGIVPDPDYLLTEPARDPDTINWASWRSTVWREAYLERQRNCAKDWTP